MDGCLHRWEGLVLGPDQTFPAREPVSDVREPAVDLGRRGWRRFPGVIGPGVVSGAADTDPTTVATMAVIGAGTIYGLCWLTILLFPIIAVVQIISTQVGAASRCDLQTLVTRSRGRLLRWLLLVSIVSVNVVTIAADLEGGAAAVGLLVHRDWRWFVLPLSVVWLTVLLVIGYHRIQRVLQYVLLCLFSYGAAAFFAFPDWAAVAGGSVIPHVEWNYEYLADMLSLLGTTLTSYVYVWQTIALAEEQSCAATLRARKLDAVLGSFVAVAVCWFILVATGATLGVHHRHIDTAAQAAQALRPVAGAWAGALFAVGLLASALVALPVLMATTAYVTGAQMNWRRGLSCTLRQAPLFYAALCAAALLGAALAFSDISPIRLLFVAGIIGGIATPLGLILLLVAAGDRHLMNDQPVSRRIRVAGWLITIMVGGLDLLYLAQQVGTV